MFRVSSPLSFSFIAVALAAVLVLLAQLLVSPYPAAQGITADEELESKLASSAAGANGGSGSDAAGSRPRADSKPAAAGRLAAEVVKPAKSDNVRSAAAKGGTLAAAAAAAAAAALL